MIPVWMFGTLLALFSLLGLLVGWACGENAKYMEHQGQFDKGYNQGIQWAANYLRENMPTPKPFSEEDLVKELEERMNSPEAIAEQKAIGDKMLLTFSEWYKNDNESTRLIDEVDADWKDEHGEDK